MKRKPQNLPYLCLVYDGLCYKGIGEKKRQGAFPLNLRLIGRPTIYVFCRVVWHQVKSRRNASPASMVSPAFNEAAVWRTSASMPSKWASNSLWFSNTPRFRGRRGSAGYTERAYRRPAAVRVPSIRRVDGPVAEGVVQIAHAQLDMLTDILLGVRRYQIGQPAEDVVRFMENLADFTGVPVEKLSPSAEETTGFFCLPQPASRPRYTSRSPPSAHRAPPSGRCRCSHPLPPGYSSPASRHKAGGLQRYPAGGIRPADILVYSHHSGSPGSSHPKYVV